MLPFRADSRTRRLSSAGGQGLVELLISMTVLSVAVGALISVLVAGAFALQRSDQKGTALALADTQLEVYRAFSYANIRLASPLPDQRELRHGPHHRRDDPGGHGVHRRGHADRLHRRRQHGRPDRVREWRRRVHGDPDGHRPRPSHVRGRHLHPVLQPEPRSPERREAGARRGSGPDACRRADPGA